MPPASMLAAVKAPIESVMLVWSLHPYILLRLPGHLCGTDFWVQPGHTSQSYRPVIAVHGLSGAAWMLSCIPAPRQHCGSAVSLLMRRGGYPTAESGECLADSEGSWLQYTCWPSKCRAARRAHQSGRRSGPDCCCPCMSVWRKLPLSRSFKPMTFSVDAWNPVLFNLSRLFSLTGSAPLSSCQMCSIAAPGQHQAAAEQQMCLQKGLCSGHTDYPCHVRRCSQCEMHFWAYENVSAAGGVEWQLSACL